VEIGPGTFGPIDLSNAGKCWLTLRGSGRQHTIIDSQNNAISLTNSCNLDVASLTVKSVPGFITIQVSNTGDNTGVTTWTDVDVIGSGYGWSESACDINQPHPKHYWFNSRITVSTGFGSITRGYNAQCGEHWFFASEITANLTAQSGMRFALSAGGAEVHVYGGVIRMITEPGIAFGSEGAIVVGNATDATLKSELHIHGTGIDVISKGANNITVFSVKNAVSTLHANETAYNLQTPSGTITRISNNGGHVHAPYLWEHIPVSPLISVTGADMTTETVGPDINMLVYNSQCTGSGGPWYNVALRACR
jgi:hypothetical protein